MKFLKFHLKKNKFIIYNNNVIRLIIKKFKSNFYYIKINFKA